MYNLSGLYHDMKSQCIVFGVMGLISIIMSFFDKSKKEKYKSQILGGILLLMCVCSFGYHFYAIKDTRISVHEGFFIEENSEHRSFFGMEYVFSNEGGLKPIFYLDIFSKKEIYPEDFEKDMMYRIYYEEKTNIIVKVEKLE